MGEWVGIAGGRRSVYTIRLRSGDVNGEEQRAASASPWYLSAAEEERMRPTVRKRWMSGAGEEERVGGWNGMGWDGCFKQTIQGRRRPEVQSLAKTWSVGGQTASTSRSV
jgi:hypothetical protein